MTDLTNPLTEADKLDWIREHYNGLYEVFIDPAGLYDRIAELEAAEAKYRAALNSLIRKSFLTSLVPQDLAVQLINMVADAKEALKEKRCEYTEPK